MKTVTDVNTVNQIVDIFKAGRGRNTPKSNTDVAWSRK